MLKINGLGEFLKSEVLFVFALESEASNLFDDTQKLICGVGKINAAINLTKSIMVNRPKLIINLGSAGGHGFAKGDVVCCTNFIQRDMDAQGLGFKKFETPLSDNPIELEYGISYQNLKKGICGTGDSFETQHINDEYNVIDMEAYPLALIAQKENIPFICLKYISDGADEDAADDWSIQVHKAAAEFKKILF